MEVVYLDNAATSYPKPQATLDAMMRYQREIGGSPGRSGHRLSIEAGRVVHETREVLSRFFNINDPLRIVFTKNATEALNIALIGLLKPGDHVITTGMEHNAVMRPLRFLASRGVDLSVVPCSERGDLDPDDIRAAFRTNTRAVVLTHASNVTGTIMPVQEIGALTRERADIVLCVDAAQTAGALPIDVEAMGVDLLAFTGHKSLYGPQGTGGLYIRKGLDEKIVPLMRGGTGSRSEFEEQPDFMPDKYECGTPNTIGLAGLCAGVAFILEQGVEAVREKEETLTRRFLNHLHDLSGDITVYGPLTAQPRISLISFNLRDIISSDAALYLDEQWGIMCRPGLHCAPAAHRTIGTFPQGTVRFSFGFFNTEEHIDLAAEALRQLLKG
ncbi:MAG: aminotransferase class V-fold PLP-dependent enzyme [Pseudomonadota bacterium]